MRGTINSIIAGFSCLCLCATLNAQTPEIIPPRPLNLEGLEAAGVGVEGLHILRLTVTAEGKTDDVEVVGGFTNPQARQFLLDLASRWRYEAGTVDGKATTFLNQEYVVRHYLSTEAVISPLAQEKLVAVGELMLSAEQDKAQRELDRLIRRDLVTVLDYALAHDILSNIHLDGQRLFEAHEASKVATMSRLNSAGNREFLLPPEMLETALRKRFMLAAALHHYAEALQAFDVLEQAFSLSDDDPIREQANELQTVLDSPQAIALLGKIVDAQWVYQPARRIFTVTDVEGRLRSIDVRCELGNAELQYEAGVDWTLPASLGQCRLGFRGRNGTTFTVHEFAE